MPPSQIVQFHRHRHESISIIITPDRKKRLHIHRSQGRCGIRVISFIWSRKNPGPTIILLRITTIWAESELPTNQARCIVTRRPLSQAGCAHPTEDVDSIAILCTRRPIGTRQYQRTMQTAYIDGRIADGIRSPGRTPLNRDFEINTS